MKIVDVKEIGEFPVEALEIVSTIEKLCNKSKKLLIEQWLAEIAELFLEKKDAWSRLFDKNPEASTLLIKRYFSSINCMLSQQLRHIVIETLNNLKEFLTRYWSGNAFDGEYKDLTFTE